MPTFLSGNNINNVITTLFQQTLANVTNIANQAAYARTVFTFTSTQRLAFLNGGIPANATTGISQNTLTQAQQLNLQTASTTSSVGYSSAISPSNLPLWPGITKSNAVISMAVNPMSIDWRQPKRINRKDTVQGSTFFHFLNRSNQNIDILTMDFRGQTGNIDLNDPSNLPKLQTWHALYNLTREPQLIGDSVINDIYINYYTKLFPMKITLIGFFTKVLEFTEDAGQPNMRNYSMSFTVKRTSPSLDTIQQAVNGSLLPFSIPSIGSGGS